jgi:pilus assembly protein TadC
MQALIVILLLLIVGSLGHALASMSAGPSRSGRMAQALTVRVSLSVGLFVLLIAGYHFGWIVPHHVH